MDDRKYLTRKVLAVSAVLLVGVAIGRTQAPVSEVIVKTKEVPVERVVHDTETVTVHDPYLPASCTETIKLADRVARLADNATDHVPDLLDAIATARMGFASDNGQFMVESEGQLRRIDSKITSQFISVQDIATQYDRAHDACMREIEP